MHKVIHISTSRREVLVDITSQVKEAVASTGIRDGIVNVYVRGATAAIMVQENWDDSVQEDVISFLQKIIPKGVWRHDMQDGNGDSHIKAGLVGPSESIPLIDGKLAFSTWQNLFCCEFDGPRDRREIVVTVIGE